MYNYFENLQDLITHTNWFLVISRNLDFCQYLLLRCITGFHHDHNQNIFWMIHIAFDGYTIHIRLSSFHLFQTPFDHFHICRSSGLVPSHPVILIKMCLRRNPEQTIIIICLIGTGLGRRCGQVKGVFTQMFFLAIHYWLTNEVLTIVSLLT